VVSALLAVAAVVGLVRLAAGLAEPLGTLVNVAWVIFDLAVMSVLVQAVRYKGFEPVPQAEPEERKSGGV
jgi:cellulose synthase (UDP-forming)